MFAGLDDSEEQKIINEKDSKIAALEAKLAQDLRTVDNNDDLDMFEGGGRHDARVSN